MVYSLALLIYQVKSPEMIQLIYLRVWKRQREANNAVRLTVMHQISRANMTISMKIANKRPICMSIILNISTTFLDSSFVQVSVQCFEKLAWDRVISRARISYYTHSIRGMYLLVSPLDACFFWHNTPNFCLCFVEGSWCRFQMEIFSALLALCARKSSVSGELPKQRPVTRSFDVFFNLRLNKRLSKQSCCLLQQHAGIPHV